MKQKARGGGGKVKKKPISTFRSVQMYNYSRGCTHIPPQQCTRLSIWGQKELNLRCSTLFGWDNVCCPSPYLFCLFCATVWLRDARVCPQLAFRLSPHPFPKVALFLPPTLRQSLSAEPVGLLYGPLFQVGTLSSTRPCWLSSSP